MGRRDRGPRSTGRHQPLVAPARRLDGVSNACAGARAPRDRPEARLAFEVTESILVEGGASATKALEELRSLGAAGGDRRLRDRLLVAFVPHMPYR